MNELDTLVRCTEQINTLPEIKARLTMNKNFGHNAQTHDAELLIKFRNQTWHCLVDVKHNLTEPATRHFRNMLVHTHDWQNRLEFPLILCTEYARKTAAAVLLEGEINYVDTVGNMYLNLKDGPYVYIAGEKPLTLGEKEGGRLFLPTGLRVLYLLLQVPGAINWPYREIAKETGVARGSVGWVFQELRDNNYVRPVGPNHLALIERRKLIDRWVTGYAEKLRPKLVKGRFRAQEKDLEIFVDTAKKVFEEKGVHWQATGTFAADLLTHHYRGETLTLFVENWGINLEQAFRWLPDPKGPITILEPFGHHIQNDNATAIPITTPLVIYAELLAIGGDRAIETAGILYRKYIEGFIDGD